MSNREMRKGFDQTVNRFASNRVSARTLATRVGSALGRGMNRVLGEGRGPSHVERLEPRQMLDGSFTNATLISLDLQGQGSSTTATIDPATPSTDNDYFRFVAPADDFVSVLADTANETQPNNLDTRLSIFIEDDLITPVATGTNNGILTSGTAKDGWGGFLARSGKTYFVVVSSETAASGSYKVRVNAASRTFDLSSVRGISIATGTPDPDVNPFPAPRPVVGELTRLEQDIVYKYSIASNADAAFSSLVTIGAEVTRPTNAATPSDRLDSRIDIYKVDVSGTTVTRVAFDSDAGRLNDAWTTLRVKPGETYYIRVRSDEVRPTAPSTATGRGSFFLVLDAKAGDLPTPLDRVTRRGSDAGGSFPGYNAPVAPPTPAVPNPAFQTGSYKFTALGNGLTIITAIPNFASPAFLNNPAVRVFDDNGNLIAYNDNFNGLSAQLNVQLVGGQQYYVVVDGFDVAGATDYQLFIESEHTQDTSATNTNDDHVSNPNGTLSAEDQRRLLEQATPLVWNTPTNLVDGNGNLVRDRGYRVSATGTGRIQGQGDTDLFQFTPPVDMLGTYAGSNDDLGTSLFIGGAFTRAGTSNTRPTVSRNLSSWDGNDYWYTGRQTFDTNLGVQYGFQDNAATPATDHAEIYTLFDYDPNPNFAPANGTSDHWLVVGGDFSLVIPTPLGPVTLTNLAVWRQSQTNGVWAWSNVLGDADGPVRASVLWDPEGYDRNGSLPNGAVTDPNAGRNPWLVVGGHFNTIGPAGVAAANIAYWDGAAWNQPGIGGLTTGTAVGLATPVPTQAGTIAAELGNNPYTVTALTVFNFADPGAGRTAAPGPPTLTAVPDPVDFPTMLVIGGNFDATFPTARSRQPLLMWDGQNDTPYIVPTVGAANVNTSTPPVVAWNSTAIVSSLNNQWDAPDRDGAAIQFQAQRTLLVGGSFTATMTAPLGFTSTATNIAEFGLIDGANLDGQIEAYAPRLLMMPLGVPGNEGTDGAVLAIAVYDPPDINNGPPIPPILVVGGAFANRGGNLGTWNGAAWTGDLGRGVDGTVRALTLVNDAQEPNIATNLLSGAPQTVLYIGGDFRNVITGPAPTNRRTVDRVTQFSAFHDNFTNTDYFSYANMATGVDTDTGRDFGPTTDVDVGDPPQFTPRVFALAAFDDGDPFSWDHHDRPSTRVLMRVNPVDGSFINSRVRVFDSNFNVVYDFARPGSDSVTPGQPDPSGMNDPSILRPPNAPTGGLDPQFNGIQVWGGETYYVEVSDLSGGGTGRYTVSVTVDAVAPDITNDRVPDEINGAYRDEPAEGSFNNAIQVQPDLLFGDVDITVNASAAVLTGNVQRDYVVSPNVQGFFTHAGDIGNISTIDDTDMFQFRATGTGTAEIRIRTRDIADQFGETLSPVNSFAAGPAFDPFGLPRVLAGAAAKTYRSALDSVLRVFRNDFEQIAYEDTNPGVLGDVQASAVGTFIGAYYRRDARVVIPVVAGNVYYIQVESGQRYKNGAPKEVANRVLNAKDEIDWRHAIGSYMVEINQMPQLTSYVRNGQPKVDDHSDALLANNPNFAPFTNATVIPMGEDPSDSATNGKGSLTGIIENRPNGTAFDQDFDLFVFNAPGNAAFDQATGLSVVQITITPAPGSGFTPDMRVWDNLTGQILGVGTPITGGGIRFQRTMRAGEQFGIIVFGNGASEGAYTVSVSGVPAVDDHANDGKYAFADTVPVLDFQNQASLNGTIEAPGDTDLFKFRVFDYTPVTITVNATDGIFDPFVTIYELSEDPAGNPIFLRVAYNNDASATNLNSAIAFPVTPDRTTSAITGISRTYPYYFAVVRGANPLSTAGSYTISISYGQTDDHPDGDTNADGNIDTGEFPFATAITIDPNAAVNSGSASGLIEVAADSDLFSFIPASSGTVTVNIARGTGSLLRFRATILDANAVAIGSAVQTTDSAGDSSISMTLTNAVRGTRYYLVIQPVTPNVNTQPTGTYTISINSPIIDDFPNAGEFTIAAGIALVPSTGIGQVGGDLAGDPSNARINYLGDTDLFTFTTILNGTVSITITPFDTTFGRMAPKVSLIDSTGTIVLASQTASLALGQVTVSAANALAGTKFYILVEAPAVSGADRTGEYRIRVVGPTPTTPPTGSDPSIVDFNNPTILTLNPRTADADRDDNVEIADDRDLFTFTTPNYVGTGKVFIQLITPQGSLLDATVRVLRNPNELSSSVVSFDADGIPGTTANLSFDSTGNTQYWVVVDGVGASVGSYTIRVNAQPAVNKLYFPEGFANDNIREFISIVNPNPNLDANYTLRLRYEEGTLETVVGGGFISRGSRGGTTLIDTTTFITPGLRKDVGYTIIIESDIPLGATLAHYDFGTSIGDSFTETVMPTWNFARVERDPANVRDYVVFYNANDFDIFATLTLHQNGKAPVQVSKTVPSGRRSGFNIDAQIEFQNVFGEFSAILSTTPVDSANQSAFVGVVASLSHYNQVRGTGFAVFGDSASKVGVAPSVSQGPDVDSELIFFNPNNVPASVSLLGNYARAPLTPLVRNVDVPAFGQVILSGSSLGLAASQPIGIRYTSNVAVVLTASQTQKGDADATNTQTNAGTRYFFGDAFIRTDAAGTLYLETLNLYNPANVDVNISVKILFYDGFTVNIPVTVRAKQYGEVKLHEQAQIVNNPARTGNQWFAVDASAATPFVMTMTHYDLFLGGGWTTAPVPFGIVNPISRIP